MAILGLACSVLSVHAYDRVIPTPWSIGANLTPSSCLSGQPWSPTVPDLDGAPGRPESAWDEVLGFANGSCHEGVGVCRELNKWVGLGTCSSVGDSQAYGSVYCAIQAQGIQYGPMNNRGVCTGTVAAWSADRNLIATKYCQAKTSDGIYDAASRQCVCKEGEFIPEINRCIKPRDRFWTSDCDICVGNPVYPLLGTKRQVIALSTIAGITISTTYDSVRRIPQSDPSELGFVRPAPLSFGMGWESTLHKSLLFGSGTRSTGNVLVNAARGGGRWTTYQFANDGRGSYVPASPGISDRLVQLRTIGGGWRYVDLSARSIETYDNSGKLQSLVTADGATVLFTYSDGSTSTSVAPQLGLLIRVADQFGRSIQFEYEQPSAAHLSPRVRTMIDAGGLRTSFDYDTNGNLTQVNWPDGNARKLLYESATLPWALTGHVDENGARAATFTYDEFGRAVGTFRAAGADSYQVRWNQAPVWQVNESWDAANDVIWRDHVLVAPRGTTVTRPNGSKQTLEGLAILGTMRATLETQEAGAGSAAAVRSSLFDTRGNLLQRDDFNGVRSCFFYDATRNVEAARVEGLSTTESCASLQIAGAPLPAGSRKHSTQWHPDWHLNTKVAQPLKLIVSVYNGQPDPFAGGAISSCAPATAVLPDGKPIVVLCKRVEQATADTDGSKGFAALPLSGVSSRIWQYSYNAYGQLLTARDPLNNQTTYQYYPDTTADYTQGDLKSVTNALGQVTQYTRYTPQGQVSQRVDPNGAVTDFRYDLRQRLTEVSIAGASTGYEYWPTGLLKRAVQPDGSYVSYEYDDAHRLTAVSDARGNRIEYMLDSSGNRVAEKVKDPNGALTRQVTRAFDALGRVQQIAGRE